MSTGDDLSPLGRAALLYAQEAGASVFPLRSRGKKPLFSEKDGGHGFLDATTHAEQIIDWWTAHPAANIGLVPGSMQWLVLDVDGPEGEVLARAFGAFDVETTEVATVRGVHRYYRLPRGVTIGNIHRKDLDVRAHAGYVVAPPSVRDCGHVYRWRGALDEIADIPERLLAALVPPPPSTAARSFPPRTERQGFDSLTECRVFRYFAKVGFGIGEGGRNNAAYSLARFLVHDLGLSEHEAGSFLSAWNRHNSPPLSDRELAAVHRSARCGRARAGAT
ncbi:MAG: bifunctional DNA primase/polymerase [Gemmatimonadaceae bacterium]